jgi:hypothetical protein
LAQKGVLRNPIFRNPPSGGESTAGRGGRWNPYVTSQLGGFVNPKTLLVLVVVAFELAMVEISSSSFQFLGFFV